MSSIYFNNGRPGLRQGFGGQGGFTLVEMMVVISIVIIMLGVVLANLPAFRDRTSLDLVAQEVALVIRQAQSYGTNTRGFLAGGSAEFPSYGVYFNISASGVDPSPTSFRLFGDRSATPDNHFSDANNDGCGGALECREIYNLSGGLNITGLFLCNSSQCYSQNYLNIVFNRPNPEAHFTDNNGGAGSPIQDLLCNGSVCSYAKITLHQQRSNTVRDICIWTTGHIYTKPTCP